MANLTPLRPWAAVSLLALALAGCDPQAIRELEEGVATEADVRARFGEPENIWDAADGGRTFEYNRQPAGHRNYMITIGADGKMSALRQVLTPANFDKVQPGMAMEEVRKMLGKPARITPIALSGERAYDWRYLEPGNTQMVFTVFFDRDLRALRSTRVADPSQSSQRHD